MATGLVKYEVKLKVGEVGWRRRGGLVEVNEVG